MKRRLPLARAAAVVILSSLPAVNNAYGQVLKGQILGVVTDATSAVVPGAKVTLTDTGKGVQASGLTNAQGNYVFVNLDPGMYDVLVEQLGFNRGIRTGIDLQPNTTVRVDIELQPGNVTETVQVSASAPLLQTDRADTGGQIDQVQLQNMPLLSTGTTKVCFCSCPASDARSARIPFSTTRRTASPCVLTGRDGNSIISKSKASRTRLTTAI